MTAHDYHLNQTRLDAFYRVADARSGSLSGDPFVGPPTLEYLHALRLEVTKWLTVVDEELVRLSTDSASVEEPELGGGEV